jgi:hypothetical protein
MNEVKSYEVNPNTGASFEEKPKAGLSFQEKEEVRVGKKIEGITTEIASNMQANLDPEVVNSTRKPVDKDPFAFDILQGYFGNVEVKNPKASIDIYPYGEFNYESVDIQGLNEDFTAEKLVSILLWSSAMLKLPVETYRSSMDLSNFEITPKAKEEILRYMLKKGNTEVSEKIIEISNKSKEEITPEDITYLVEARKDRGGITKEEVDEEVTRVRRQIVPLLLEDKWENLPPEVLSHVLSIDAQIETIELGDLINEVYPAFRKYREDIKEALKLAFLDKNKFVEKYVEDEDVVRDIKGFLSNLNRRAPVIAKGAFSIGMILLAFKLVACTPDVEGATNISSVEESSATQEQTNPTLERPISDTDIEGTYLQENNTNKEVGENNQDTEPTVVMTEETTEEYSPRPTWNIDEQTSKYGYRFGIDFSYYNSETEADESVLTVMKGGFVYQEYKVTYEGHFLVGTINYKGENREIRVLVNPETSRYITGNSWAYTFRTRSIAQEHLIEEREYWFNLVPFRKSDRSYIRCTSFDNYSDQEWKDFRNLIDDLFKSGGDNSEFGLELSNIRF